MSSPVGLTVHIAELRRHVGEQRVVSESIPVAELDSDPLQLVTFGVQMAPDTDVAVELLLEAISGGISVTGTLHGRWQGICRRCLGEVSGPLVAEIDETFEDRPTDGETYLIEGDVIDLIPMMREALLLDLPPAPLCRPDCEGPAPDVVPVVVPSDESAEPPRDERWAGLDDLRDRL